MKPVIAAICLLAVALPMLAQRNTPAPYSRYNDFMQKSKRKERAGIILLSAGAVVAAGGTVLIIDGVNRNNRHGDYNGNGELNAGEAEVALGALVTVLGVGSMSASIPFFVGSHRSKKKALDISLSSKSIPLLCKTAFYGQRYPALTFQIPLGR